MEEVKLVKELAFGENARGQILAGVNKLTNAVSSTLGASGKCVILEDSSGRPIITKDGVTVANSVTLRDPLENIGATLIKEAAQRTVKDAGDGTTTATVLAQAILDEASKHDQLDNIRNIKDGITTGVDNVVKYLQKKRKKISGKKIDQVATISANNDKDLGKIIGDAFKSVDEQSSVFMDVSEDGKTYLEIVEGYRYAQPLKNNNFVTNKSNNTCELENALVLVIDNQVENIRKIQGVLEYVIKNNKSLLIIADVDAQVLNALAMNKIKGNIKVNVIDAPIFGINRKQLLSDICDITNATLINEDLGDDMDLISEDHLGFCSKVISNKDETVFHVDLENNDRVNEKINFLKKEMENSNDKVLINRNQQRISSLKCKLAIVKVGASSEVELQEKKDRVEDAICATKAALKEGIVAGGGIALYNASKNLTPKNIGEEVLYCAIRKPFETILHNAGVQEYDTPSADGQGLDVVTGKTVDMVKAGIIDPLLVTKSALRNAASVATTIMSTDCVINNIRV